MGANAPELARLRRAVAQIAPAQPHPPPPSPTSGEGEVAVPGSRRDRATEGVNEDLLRAILRVERRETPAGPVFVRDDWFPPDHRHGSLTLDAPLRAGASALARIVGDTQAPAAHRLAYFDIETTGLSGGTGTYVILAGLGSFEADGFRMRQYFLADVGQERAMLAALAADLARFEGLVTYNGRAFDVPCLESRLTLTRVPSPCAGLAHLDLLLAVRRLYRHRMPACKLSDAERRLLGIERWDDIPGSLIPPMYFDYARAGRVAPLRAVFRHNAEDVMSLAGILAGVAGLLEAGDLDPEDAVAVARWHERTGDDLRAMALYGDALPWLAGGEDWTWAAARHARLCRRAGMREEAVALWSALWREGDAAAGLELAKHYEHHARDYAAAEAIAAALANGAAHELQQRGLDAEALAHRLLRIRKRAGRIGTGTR